MTMPWDKYKPDTPVPVPAPEVTYNDELPYNPPTTPKKETPNLPLSADQFNMINILKEAFVGAMKEVGNPPDSKAQHAKDLVSADARSRSWRTFVQGISIDIFFALLATLGTLTNFDPLDKAAWTTLGVLVVKTLVQTVFAYVMRLRVTPTIRERGDKMAVMPLPVEIRGE